MIGSQRTDNDIAIDNQTDFFFAIKVKFVNSELAFASKYGSATQ